MPTFSAQCDVSVYEREEFIFFELLQTFMRPDSECDGKRGSYIFIFYFLTFACLVKESREEGKVRVKHLHVFL